MFDRIKRIDTPEEIKEHLPLSPELAMRKAERDKLIEEVLTGKSARKLVVIGPCSADNEDSVSEYVYRLAEIQRDLSDKLVIVPRIYTNKPRTKGEGYKGMLHQPDPEKPTDVQEGILSIRRLHLRVLKESGLSCADEMLYPENHPYLDDLLSYVAVGARSSENQTHRLVASGIDLPAGIKNPMNGSVSVLLNSIYAAQIPNEFKYNSYQVKTNGNPLAHAVLRGKVDAEGTNLPNYHYEDIVHFSELYEKTGLKNPAIIIDTNHSNSGKNPFLQIRIVHEVLNNCKYSPEYAKYVKGFMIESYLLDGCQPCSGKEYGKSITDACLGWEKTEKLLQEMADKVIL